MVITSQVATMRRMSHFVGRPKTMSAGRPLLRRIVLYNEGPCRTPFSELLLKGDRKLPASEKLSLRSCFSLETSALR